MAYRSTRDCVEDLLRTRQLVVLSESVDAHLEIAAIQRRLYAAGGPAILFANVRGCRFPVVSNLFGTLKRARFVLRHGLRAVETVMRWKAFPTEVWQHPARTLRTLAALPHALPRWISGAQAPVLQSRCAMSDLPAQVSWPRDGGPFITLPQVYSEEPGRPGWMRSNLGMYRIQMAGNAYRTDHEVGMHYQLHRGLGLHQQQAELRGLPLPVNVFVGGPPAHSLAAVMPLPEGMPEIAFAGLLAGRSPRLARAAPAGLTLAAEADFCITGKLLPGAPLKPEGPFGDHLGYYSLVHNYPVLQVEAVYHRPDAIWPCTTVGRPPQEDTSFGQLIHELTGPVLPTVLAGVHALNAVDAAGVHPLLLVQASERYTPFQERRRPQELLTIANAVLGQGQLSLAKYLLIVAREDSPGLDVHDIGAFLRHLLERVDWRRDLHFQTQTTIDTLDYSGEALNQGSKVVIAAVGDARRSLGSTLPEARMPDFEGVALAMPGVLLFRSQADITDLPVPADHPFRQFPLWVAVDDPEFCAARLDNFLWVTFTRSNPALDIQGVDPFTTNKHWGCRGPLIIDARVKPHHAPILEEDAQVSRHVEALAAPRGPLHGLF